MLTNTLYNYTALIEIPFGELTAVIDWCNTNNIEHWDYCMIDSAGALPGKYEFHFTAEYDYVNFMLWKR